jgi:2,4-dienoyl-CoA reductase-like NADH-dependent reductase (Old Yellow Enzyme family)/thioredoxin reductase
MAQLKFPELFKPFTIGKTYFRNRIFSAPTGHPDVTLDGWFTEDAITYYERKAQGGAAAITLGEAIVDSKYGRRHAYQACLDDINLRHNLSRLADSVSRHGAILSMELQHSGMNAAAPGTFGDNLIYGPSACVNNDGVPVQEMPEDVIYHVINKFAEAAKFVKDCGFGLVTVHAGHGWLLNQFFAPRLNHRTDKWGGSPEGRARFTVEVVDAIHALCGKDFPVEVRISGTEAHDYGYGIEEGVKLAECLDGHADIIHVSVGCSAGLSAENDVFATTHPDMFKDDGCNVKYAAEVKKHITKSLVATVGALVDPNMMENIISTGQADIVEMARGLIADPDIPNKARTGREDEIIPCIRCLSCFSHLMFHGHFFCALNPETSRERYFERELPRARKQKVLIAGGGVGGMEAAITAVQYGHDVTLCEKSGKLGGGILCEEDVPFKKHLKEYIERRAAAISKLPIKVCFNTEVTPEYAEQQKPDVIIAAVGASPIVPGIPGIDGKNVISAEDAYKNPETCGKSVSIIGGGLVGLELAIYLAQFGKNVSVLEKDSELNFSGNFLHGRAIVEKLRIYGVKTFTDATVTKITDIGVEYAGQAGASQIDADSVIYAVGYSANTAAVYSLNACAPIFHAIGDCNVPKTIGEATVQAHTIAKDIGRF